MSCCRPGSAAKRARTHSYLLAPEPGRRQILDMPDEKPAPPAPAAPEGPSIAPREVGGPKGPEPTRYGDWEFKGRCIDF